MNDCPNCGEEYTESRPFKCDAYEGKEFYCKNCPPDKWSRIEVTPTSADAKQTWNEIMQAVKDTPEEFDKVFFDNFEDLLA
jgi:hypothetical protein